MAVRFENPWSSEHELAEAFRAQLEREGWVVHPESCGFDLFAVYQGWEPDIEGSLFKVRRGQTLGVEVKLDAGRMTEFLKLMDQVLPRPVRGNLATIATAPGPHYRAAVAARFADDGALCRRFGVVAFRAAVGRWIDSRRREWRRADWSRGVSSQFWPCFAPTHVPEPPEIVIDVPSGVPSPRTGGKRRILLVRLAMRMRSGEVLDRHEIEAMGLPFSSVRHLLDPSGRRRGRRVLWTLNSNLGDRAPDRKWPDLLERLQAKDAADGGPCYERPRSDPELPLLTDHS